MKCPSLISLLNFMRHRPSEAENAELGAHLSTGCPRCRENQQWLEEVVRLKAGDNSFDAPEELIQWLVAQFKVASASFSPAPSRLRRLFAELVFDGLPGRRLAGVRSERTGGEMTGPRQLLYHAEGYDIDLRFERTKGAESEEMVGQVLPERKLAGTPGEFTIRLLKDENEIERTVTDPSGMFVFARVPSERFDLKIDAPEGEICLDQINAARNS
jgi:hypothetical protein